MVGAAGEAPMSQLPQGGVSFWGGCVEARGGPGVGGTMPTVATIGPGEVALGAGKGDGWGPAAGTMAGVRVGAWQVQC